MGLRSIPSVAASSLYQRLPPSADSCLTRGSPALSPSPVQFNLSVLPQSRHQRQEIFLTQADCSLQTACVVRGMRQTPQEFLHCSVSYCPLPCPLPTPRSAPPAPPPLSGVQNDAPHSADLPHLFPPTPVAHAHAPGPVIQNQRGCPSCAFHSCFSPQAPSTLLCSPSKRPSRFFSLRPVLTVTADDRRQSSSRRRALLSLTSTFLSGLSHPIRTTHDIVDRPRPQQTRRGRIPTDGFKFFPILVLLLRSSLGRNSARAGLVAGILPWQLLPCFASVTIVSAWRHPQKTPHQVCPTNGQLDKQQHTQQEDNRFFSSPLHPMLLSLLSTLQPRSSLHHEAITRNHREGCIC